MALPRRRQKAKPRDDPIRAGWREDNKDRYALYHQGLHPESQDRGKWSTFDLLEPTTQVRLRLAPQAQQLASGPGLLALNWRCPVGFAMLQEMPPGTALLLLPSTRLIGNRPDSATMEFSLVVASYPGPIKLRQRTGRILVRGPAATVHYLQKAAPD